MKWILVATTIACLGMTTPALAQNVTLQQCANGPASTPRVCADSAWVTNGLTAKTSHYREGNAIPFRAIITKLFPGQNGLSLTLEWDTTEGGRHAFDYLTSFNFSETVNPCSGVAGCASVTSFFAIPNDGAVSNAGVTMAAGSFAMFGGTIDSVTTYSRVGSYDGRSTTFITVNFTANQANVVLTWGGHLAREIDWGPTQAVSSVPGSSFHMGIYGFSGKNQGTQARQIAYVAGPL